MKTFEILELICKTSGTNDKKDILLKYHENETLKNVLKYGLNPFTPFHVIKVPGVEERILGIDTEEERWLAFFEVADACANREITGNSAIAALHGIFSAVLMEEEKWMRKILKKHLAIGASTKTVNKVFPGLIPTFEVALAQKFEEKRLENSWHGYVAVEPKFDGIRCFAIVENGAALLYARSGKLISNFNNTIGAELALLPDGCYDGEVMGEDFVALMRQAYRKDNVVTEGTYLALFDYLPMDEWKSRKAKVTCKERYLILYDNLKSVGDLKYLQCVRREIVPAIYDDIKRWHDDFVSEGYEGVMVKDFRRAI